MDSRDFRFRKLQIYVVAKGLYIRVQALPFPRHLEYLQKQILRASLSVVLNIAEGSAKESDKDFFRYLQNSLGSLHETVAGLEIAYELTKAKDIPSIIEGYADLKRQIGALSKKLKADG